jgi:serine/threonine protein kinase
MISDVADYRIIEPLGGGDDEQLFAAVPPPRLGLLTDRVAIKVVFGLSDEKGVHRATDELRIFAAVDSPFLVHLYDAGQDDDALFYAMEYPVLGTLAAPVRPLSADESLLAVACACRGAHALHEAGIAHRNITPGRVLLHEPGAKLADLGMAKFISPGLTVSRMPDVTDVEYLDPAVIRGARPSRASDIWSLGVVLHFALSGGQSIHPGSVGQEPLAAIRQALNEPPLIADEVPASVASVIRMALAADPAERPATAADLASRIEALRGN